MDRTDREALDAALDRLTQGGDENYSPIVVHAPVEQVIDAVLGAGFRRPPTALADARMGKALARLPLGSIVTDVDGDQWAKRGTYRYELLNPDGSVTGYRSVPAALLDLGPLTLPGASS